MCESGHGLSFTLPMVRQLELCRRNVADGLEQAPIVEPIYPAGRCVLDRIDVPPRALAVNDRGFPVEGWT